MTTAAATQSRGSTFPTARRSRTTNKPLTRANGNTAAGRRVRDLYRGFMRGIGNPADVIAQAHALHAAELLVAVEQTRLRAARGEPVDVDALVRLSNLADRAAKRLRLDQRHEPSAPSLEQLLGHAERSS